MRHAVAALAAGLVTIVSADALAQTLDVQVRVLSGVVDAEHPVFVMLTDAPGGGRLVAVERLDSNNATARFVVSGEAPRYAGALYDRFGIFTGLGLPPESPFRRSGEQPLRAGDRAEIVLSEADATPPWDGEGVAPQHVVADNGILEVRTYTLEPGTRERFVRLFEERIAPEQERLGARIVAQLPSLQNPDQFVWIRAYPNQRARIEALRAFYLGSVWLDELRVPVNEMLVSTELLLVEPTASSLLR